MKSAALLLLVAFVSPLFRHSSAATRHVLWSGALTAALLLPVLSLALPAWRVSWLPSWPAATADAPATNRSPLREQRELTPPASPELVEWTATTRDEGVTTPSDTPPAIPPSAYRIPPSALRIPPSDLPSRSSVLPSPSGLLLLWLTGALLALLPLLAGWVQAVRITRRARLLDSPAWGTLLATAAQDLGLRRPVRLGLAPGAPMPFTWGVFQPMVILPEDGEHWPEARRRLVLLHELGHVRRLDWLTQTFAALACALHWFNPLVWLAARHIRLEREQACDDLVLGCGSLPKDYARELLALATASSRPFFLDWTTVPMARRSTLEVRLRAILDGRRQRATLSRTAALFLVALLAATALPLAMLRGAGAPAEKQTPPPAAATTSSRILTIEHQTVSLAANPGLLADKDAVIVGEGGVLDIGPGVTTVSTLTLRGGTIIGPTGSKLSVQHYEVQSGTVSANVGGPDGITKTGSGTVTLSGQNSFTGTTTVSSGTLVVVNSNAMGAGAVTVNRAAPVPGWLTPADIAQAIGPALGLTVAVEPVQSTLPASAPAAAPQAVVITIDGQGKVVALDKRSVIVLVTVNLMKPGQRSPVPAASAPSSAP